VENYRAHEPPSEARQRLIRLARASGRVDVSRIPASDRAAAEKYFDDNLLTLSPGVLANMILMQPTVHLRETGGLNTGFVATYEANPIMNLYFMRDQMITTAKGIVLGKMSSEQRAPETEVVKLALSNLGPHGIKPILEVSGDGRLEGGDFIPAGDTAFIGEGLRTNAAAIRQMLDAQVFGSRWVVVVKEKWHNQEQMHLDTYFNIADKNLAMLVQSRVDAAGRQSGDKLLKCDVYELKDGKYQPIGTDLDFVSYLKQKGFQIVPVPDEDQKRYGVNFLTTAPRTIAAVAGQSPEYQRRLEKAGVKVSWMDFSNLRRGYGAAHCMTQVFRRCATPPVNDTQDDDAAPAPTPPAGHSDQLQ
jgi:arginine deiminase